MESIDNHSTFNPDFDIKLCPGSMLKIEDGNDNCKLLQGNNIVMESQHNKRAISAGRNPSHSYGKFRAGGNRNIISDTSCSQREIRRRIEKSETSIHTSPKQQQCNSLLKEETDAGICVPPKLVSIPYPEMKYIDYSTDQKEKSTSFSNRSNHISNNRGDVNEDNTTNDFDLTYCHTSPLESNSRFLGGTFNSINDFLSSSLPSGVNYNLEEINTNDMQVKGVTNSSFSSLQSDFDNHKISKDISLSGRPQFISDLEDKGFINLSQCDALKDLVTSEDTSLQTSVDKYTKADMSHTESMIKSGPLHHKMCMDIDLLSDLDLEFLRVNGELGLGLDTTSRSKVNNSPTLPIQQNPNSVHADSILIQQLPDQVSENSTSNSINIASPSHLIPPSCVYDEIGDLDFNLGCSDRFESDGYVEFSHQHSFPESAPIIPSHSDVVSSQVRDHHCNHSPDTAIEGRFRANSLAFGGLLEEPTEDENQSIGKWMDRSPLLTQESNVNIQHIPLNLKRITQPSILVETYCGQNDGEDELVRNQDKTASRFEKRMVKWKSTRNGNHLPDQLDIAALRCRRNEGNIALPLVGNIEKNTLEKLELRVKNGKEVREQTERSEIKIAAIFKQKNEGKKKVKKNNSPKSMIREQYSREHSKEIMTEEMHKEVTSGTGRPRSLSDPNLLIGFDENGLLYVDGPPDWIGAYSPESRKIRIERFLAKRNHRVWVKKVKYDVRKNFADSRLRVKGRFVKKEDELLVRDLLSLT